MEYLAREHLSILDRSIKNVYNIKLGVITMMHCRLNSECQHEGHEMSGCPNFLNVYAETCETARPMFEYAKDMVAKALERFESTLDTIIQSLPPDMPDDVVWDTAIEMVENGVYNMMAIVADAKRMPDCTL